MGCCTGAVAQCELAARDRELSGASFPQNQRPSSSNQDTARTLARSAWHTNTILYLYRAGLGNQDVSENAKIFLSRPSFNMFFQENIFKTKISMEVSIIFLCELVQISLSLLSTMELILLGH